MIKEMNNESRWAEGPLPAESDEKVLEVKDGIVTKKEVGGKVFYRARCARSGKRFWEAEGTPFYCSISSEAYWCS